MTYENQKTLRANYCDTYICKNNFSSLNFNKHKNTNNYE